VVPGSGGGGGGVAFLVDLGGEVACRRNGMGRRRKTGFVMTKKVWDEVREEMAWDVRDRWQT